MLAPPARWSFQVGRDIYDLPAKPGKLAFISFAAGAHSSRASAYATARPTAFTYPPTLQAASTYSSCLCPPSQLGFKTYPADRAKTVPFPTLLPLPTFTLPTLSVYVQASTMARRPHSRMAHTRSTITTARRSSRGSACFATRPVRRRPPAGHRAATARPSPGRATAPRRSGGRAGDDSVILKIAHPA